MPTADPAPARDDPTGCRPRSAASTAQRAPRAARGQGRLPPRHRGAAGGRHPHRARVPRGPSGARRLRRRRHLLRHLRLPDHRAARRRARPQRVDLVDPVRGAPHPPPAAGRGAGARDHLGVCRGSSCPACAGATSASTSRRPRCTSSTGSSRAARPTTWPPTCCPRRCSTSGRWPWRSSSTSSGRCCSSCWRWWCAGRAAGSWPLALGALVASSFVWSVWFSHTSPRPAFFTTTTRVWELGIGALLAVALAGRPRPTTAARGSAALGWAALAALRRRRALAAAGHRLAGGVGPAAHPADRGAALGRLAGIGARPGAGARHRADGLGRCACPTRSTSGTGRSSSWAAGSPTAFGATLPAWGLVAARPRLGRARVAVVAVRRVADPPRAVAARPAPGPARRRPRPVLRRRARRPAAVRAALALHHHAARRHPPAAVPARRRDAAAGAALHAGRRPRLAHPRPARLGGGPAQGRRRPLPGARRRHHPGGVHLRRPAGAAPRSRSSATPRRCSGCPRWRRPPRPADGGWSPTASRRAPSPTPPRPRPARPTPSATRGTPPSWTPCAPTRPTSSSPPGWRRAPGPAAAPSASPSSTATPRAGPPSRMPVCPSSSSATARSRPTTSTSAPRGTRPS